MVLACQCDKTMATCIDQFVKKTWAQLRPFCPARVCLKVGLGKTNSRSSVLQRQSQDLLEPRKAPLISKIEVQSPSTDVLPAAKARMRKEQG